MATVSKDVLDRFGSLSWFASNVLNLKLSPAQSYMLSLGNMKIPKTKTKKLIEELKPLKHWTNIHHMIIKEGEDICPVCHGEKGFMSHYCKPPGSQWVVCKRCDGDGKIDWIRKAMM